MVAKSDAKHAPRPAKCPDATPDSPPPATGAPAKPVREIGGRDGPDPTRYGDWERGGRCIDF